MKILNKKNTEKKPYLKKKILVFVVIIAVIITVYAIFWGHALYRPFEDFKGPVYIPKGYNLTDNLTTDNERIFEYSGNGTFWVGLIKDPNKKELNETLNPFADDSQNINETNEIITVNGHNVTFKVHEMSIDMQEITSDIPILSKYTMPTIKMAKFQAKWYCEETNLTYVAIGFVTSDQLEEMKKMIESIQCHPEKSLFNLNLGI
ncbi:hypothetical protein [Methanobacterium congolense]|uniref:Region of a membrane-bound protein predicted to be embedded in the membrane n=1 Tax=Methanobacterium congolense TaxID=118062 RepID=A0A1D3L3A1_9EURY|nr:hypothetical protein [Methanobacterium congolense]SCG86033.1 Region of a membrane-bound protein predicted to be embedded in the membrane [Methanobacterium congolense]